MSVQSFPPIAAPDAGCLILGTMPGAASLRAGEYYAHPRNAFWPVMEHALGIGRHLPYAERTRALAAARIALWDVLARCVRTTSLDSDIDPGSVVANDFADFLERHAGVRLILFNGGEARRLFERHVAATLPPARRAIARRQLPSTSPTNARLDLAAKCAAWQEALAARHS